MGSRVTLRTKCCESYKIYGVRCSVCPNRPENRELLREITSAPTPLVTSSAGRPFRSCFRQEEEPAELLAAVAD